ncbi:hypothetical protein AFCDBAGC_1519 [Methylobacterium cerastii]|uniref:DUF2214 domain-containing protein n=1 Tax=Methylobacterium cerastii TaxID=932741 RepID=A0ABQ4QEW3_9HYPH|nr:MULTISPECIES: hypothetical protein [Methylobacterium]GJD43667.1 hypothetical protein AFCDBAGC_1519 [Methylobacterium cerastii]
MIPTGGPTRPLRTLSSGAVVAGALAVAGCLVWALPACAAEPITLPMPAPLPPIRILTLLVGLHLIGLCLGLGGATMLDFWILRWMRWGGLPAEIARTFLFVSKVVSVGIGLLWVSGLGFLALYWFESPEKLANPKLVAKVSVVVVLTVNGLLIHALVLPGVLRDVSRPMFEGVSRLRTGVFLISGAISGVSWYAAFAMGLMRELNGRVGYGPLLGLWFVAVVAGVICAYVYWMHLRERSAGLAAVRVGLSRLPRIPDSALVSVGRAPPARVPPMRRHAFAAIEADRLARR